MGERRMERETGAGEKKRERETGMGERKIEREEWEREIGRETGVGERERQRERERERERERQGRKKKNYKHKKIMQFYLVLYSAERSEARQWIVVRQVTCYNPLSFFNPVTRDKVGKKMIERETGWERERKI